MAVRLASFSPWVLRPSVREFQCTLGANPFVDVRQRTAFTGSEPSDQGISWTKEFHELVARIILILI